MARDLHAVQRIPIIEILDGLRGREMLQIGGDIGATDFVARGAPGG